MITFSSDAYENITYFDAVARNLLLLMGHSGTVPGALKAEEVGAALMNLKEALGQRKTASNVQEDADDQEPVIDLAKRAIPLLHLLEAAAKKPCAVLWGNA